jgi:V/A-type H+-transporting ATPase subunit A
LDSWSKYKSVIRTDWVEFGRRYLRDGTDVESMMKVVGEEGTSLADFIVYLKGNFLDSVYLQQNSFDEVDAAADVERQTYVYKKILTVLGSNFELNTKDEARTYFNQLRQSFIDWNYAVWMSDAFKKIESDIDSLYSEKSGKLETTASLLLKEDN